MRHTTLIIAVLALAIAAPAIAGKGGNGNGNGGNGGSGGGGGGGNVTAPSGSCTVNGDLVNATGLPTGEVINFMITDANGSWGWVLGYTDTGAWSVSVPAAAGTTTYEFASRTWGPDGAKYSVFASCSN
jgi:hypothetical protein